MDTTPGTAFTMEVEAGKIREFATATMSRNPAYFEADPISPVTFLQSSAFWQVPGSSVWDGLARDMSRVLHGAQEFVFPAGPPRAGVRLTGQSRVEREYTKSGSRGGDMHFIDVRTDYRDDAGTVVAEVRTTTIITGQAPPTAGETAT